MPRYFFDVTDETGVHADEVGLELANMETALLEARRALADMTRESLIGQKLPNITIRIRDGNEGPVDLRILMQTERPDG
jgi:hypothetical protein